MTFAALSRARLAPIGVVAALLTLALGLGALQAYVSFAVHPLLLPALLAGAGVVVASLFRPEIGLAAALVLVTAGRLLPGPLPPWLPTLALSAFLFLVALWRFSGTRGDVARLPRLTLPLLALFAATLLSFGASGQVSEAAPVLRALLTGSFLFFAAAVLLRRPRQFAWVVAGAAGAAAILAFHAAFLDDSAIGYVTNAGVVESRATAGFASPNALGGLLAPLVPVALAGAVLVPVAAPLFVLASAAATYGVYLSLSRGAFLGLAVAPLIAFRPRWLVIVLPAMALAVFVFAPEGVERRIATTETQQADVAGRADIWRVAGHVFVQQPVLGAGPGAFPRAYSEAAIPGKEYLGVLALIEHPPHAHNLALQMLSEQGVVGLLALIVLFGAALVLCLRLRRSPDRWLRVVAVGGLGSLAVLVGHNVVDVTFIEETMVVMLALFGLLSAADRVSRAGSSAA